MSLLVRTMFMIYSGDETYQFSAAHRLRIENCEPNKSLAALSEPKPDIWFAFPIDHNHNNRDSLFSFGTLKELEDNLGLVSCPLMSFKQYVKEFEKLPEPGQIDHKLVCYPFLLIEIKKNDQKEDKLCYCQAANDCSASLSLLEHFARPWKHCSVEVLPVVAFTFVGPEAKLWLAFTHGLSYTDLSRKKWRTKHVRSNRTACDRANLSHIAHAMYLGGKTGQFTTCCPALPAIG